METVRHIWKPFFHLETSISSQEAMTPQFSVPFGWGMKIDEIWNALSFKFSAKEKKMKTFENQWDKV